MKNTSKKKKATDFEETCMWMSYRYAIGRHTIASVTHANDIAVNMFHKLSNERKEFTSYDIAREIDARLTLTLHFFIDPSQKQQNTNYWPLEYFFEFLEEANITNLNELGDYLDIRCTDKSFKTAKSKERRQIYVNEIDDLIPWQQLAAAFDIKNLVMVTTEYNGKIEEHICFPTYFKKYMQKTVKDLQGNDYTVNDPDNIVYEMHYMSLDSYLRGNTSSYIADEYIKDKRPLTEAEQNQFDIN